MRNNRHRTWSTPLPPVVTEPTWFVTYSYQGEHPWSTLEHRDTDPRHVVQWMRHHFAGSAHVKIHRVWEEVPPNYAPRQTKREMQERLSVSGDRDE